MITRHCQGTSLGKTDDTESIHTIRPAITGFSGILDFTGCGMLIVGDCVSERIVLVNFVIVFHFIFFDLICIHVKGFGIGRCNEMSHVT